MTINIFKKIALLILTLNTSILIYSADQQRAKWLKKEKHIKKLAAQENHERAQAKQQHAEWLKKQKHLDKLHINQVKDELEWQHTPKKQAAMEQQHVEWLKKQPYLKEYLIALVKKEQECEQIDLQLTKSQKRHLHQAKYRIYLGVKSLKEYRVYLERKKNKHNNNWCESHQLYCDFKFKCEHRICPHCVRSVFGKKEHLIRLVCLRCGMITRILNLRPNNSY